MLLEYILQQYNQKLITPKEAAERIYDDDIVMSDFEHRYEKEALYYPEISTILYAIAEAEFREECENGPDY